jgi:ABC-type nickel/cobalt efflux system permease component RcnA
MTDLNTALQSGSLTMLLLTALALGALHTVLGPDHYVPFVMMAKAQRWSRRKTLMVTSLCGLGHVGSSVVIGIILAVGGMMFTEWDQSAWAAWHGARGDVAAWLLMGLGAALLVYGFVRALRGRTHSHPHLHPDGTVHTEVHDHTGGHMHVHDGKVKRLTPWMLFTIFVFGPCESLIPLMLASWAVAGAMGAALVAAVFSLATMVAILAMVGLLLPGVSRIPLGKANRWSMAVAGLSLVLCGAAIRWLGL